MRLLIVGSLNGQVAEATKIAMDRGARVSHAETSDIALNHLRSGQGADLVMMEVGQDIKGFLAHLVRERILVPVVACGVDTDPTVAAQAIRDGAKEYVPLPPEAELIAAVLEAVTEESHAMIYQDHAMDNIVRLADQIAKSDASVLITGESGTGKEVMARYVHAKSNRADKSFISINCAAIPDNLLESELFGHEKGSFTGAVTRRIGKFEEASGGTLLLDEISEMEPRLQAKLLRAIQEREIDRVGGSKPVKIDIRVIATSNRDLAEAVKSGAFREDLMFRLNVVNLRLPPLRERPADIVELANHFLDKFAEANSVARRQLAKKTGEILLQQEWPGNVRELENTMHRAVLLATGDEIGPEAIMTPDGQRHDANTPSSRYSPVQSQIPSTTAAGETVNKPQASAPLVGRTVAEVERDLIIDTLYHCLGNRTHAANILGISIRTLRNKLKQYSEDGVDVPMPGDADRASV
jgi:two-component system response regulator FlrC